MSRKIIISEESQSILDKYSMIPMAFESDIVLDINVIKGGIGGFSLNERNLNQFFKKDYDAIESEGPRSWSKQFDLSNWGFLVARIGDEVIGGATIAYNTPEVNMLEGRLDLAVLWDIRVLPNHQRCGVGCSLFKASDEWAIQKNCRTLKIETQNNNVAACKFYLKQRCELGGINRFAYPRHPDEVQLLWYKTLKARN